MRPLRFLLVLLFLANCLAATAAAQAGQAELTGEVRDHAGSVIVNCNIKLTEKRINRTYASTVSASGVYTFTNLKPGLYTVVVEAAGFKRHVRERIRLATGEKVRLDVELEVGSVSESITITSDASLLRTESGSLGQVVS